ncbi:hypothetical protein ACKS0A_09264 [Histoplasma ohiense]
MSFKHRCTSLHDHLQRGSGSSIPCIHSVNFLRISAVSFSFSPLNIPEQSTLAAKSDGKVGTRPEGLRW